MRRAPEARADVPAATADSPSAIAAPTAVPYTEIAPPPDLAAFVDRLWLRTTVRGSSGVHRVLPDGCVDILVRVDRGTAQLVGTMTRAQEVPDVPAQLVAVRFRPGTAAAVTGCALAELTDRDTDLAELGIADDLVDHIVGGPGRFGRVDRIADPRSALPARLPISTADHARLAALVVWLRRRLAGAAPPDPLVARAVAQLSTGEARIDGVAGELGVTRQHLARRFRREVGISPKQLARVARMQRAAAALRRSGDLAHPGGNLARPGGDLARLAADLGYFDQSHLSHELRDLIGMTPAAVAAERPIVLSHLFGEDR